MSEQRKRLTDAEVEALYRGKVGGARQADHLQAREDRKRLAERLREVTGGGHDINCTIHPEAPAVLGVVLYCDCLTGQLLQEVDPQ